MSFEDFTQGGNIEIRRGANAFCGFTGYIEHNHKKFTKIMGHAATDFIKRIGSRVRHNKLLFEKANLIWQKIPERCME